MNTLTRFAIASALGCLVALGTYFAMVPSTAFHPTPVRLAHAQATDPIVIGTPVLFACTFFPQLQPTPAGVQPAPRPIETGGQPLVLNPADLCKNELGTPTSDGKYTIVVKSGDMRIVRRRTQPGNSCSAFEEWYNGREQETLSTCPLEAPPGEPTPVPTIDPYDPGLWIWFRDNEGGVIEVSCGCDAPPVRITITPPPPDS